MTTKQILESDTEMLRGSKKVNGNILDGHQHEVDPFPRRLTAAERQSATKLTSSEREQWGKALRVIDNGWKTFVEVGLTLRAIRESRLYREDYDSWEAFCRDVVGVSKTEADRQIVDAEVVTELTPNGVSGKGEAPLPPPANRAQVRALARVKDSDKRREIWQQVVAESDEAPITARAIEAIIQPATEPKIPVPPAASTISNVDDTVIDETAAVGFDVIEQLKSARRKTDWTIVEAVIAHLESQ